MSTPFHYLVTAIALVVMFSLLVAAHELGHYLFARLFNMGVEEFAIGFGKKPILEWMKRTYEIPVGEGEVPSIKHSGGTFDLEGSSGRSAEDMIILDTPNGQILRETTRFTVRPWPLGGFVRIKGMLPEEDGSETTIAGGFYNKPPIQRLMVLFAGPLFSVLAGIIILIPLFMTTGIEKIVNTPYIGEVKADGPAAKAGLKEHDLVTSIDNRPIKTFFDINSIVRDSAGKALHFSIVRGGQPLNITVVPVLDKVPSEVLSKDLEPTGEKRAQGKLQTAFNHKRVFVNFPTACSMAVMTPVHAVEGLVAMFWHPKTIKDSVGGTISITVATYDAVQDGFATVVELAALLSISVGILNLLPIVPLDGGQMALTFAELLRGGKRLSMKVQSFAQMCGLAFIGVLVVSVFFLDISRHLDHSSASKEPAAQKSPK